jgi:D-glycero-D-manno-heptose 1,7-bisphosphate phosphatase
MAMVQAVFLDRDGTINEDVGYVSKPEELMIYPWAASAVRLINQAGMKAIVITNQSGVARGFCSEQEVEKIHQRMIEEIAQSGAWIDAVYYCPHHPEIGDERYRMACECRKPRSGLLHKAAREHGIDLARSYVIGDKTSDIELGQSEGLRSVLVLTGYGRETLKLLEGMSVKPSIIAENLLEAVKAILGRQNSAQQLL